MEYAAAGRTRVGWITRAKTSPLAASGPFRLEITMFADRLPPSRPCGALRKPQSNRFLCRCVKAPSGGVTFRARSRLSGCAASMARRIFARREMMRCDCQLPCDDQPCDADRACRGTGAGGQSWRRRRRSTPSPSIPTAPASPVLSRSIFPPATIPSWSMTFHSGSIPRRCGSRVRRTAELTIGAIDAKAPRAAPPVDLPDLDKRIEALKDQHDDLQGAIDCRQCAPQIRRALRRGLAGRNRRQGRGAPALGMARGLCRGIGGSRRRRHRGPRCRAQAARHRPRDFTAAIRPRHQATEQTAKCGSISPQPLRPRRSCG